MALLGLSSLRLSRQSAVSRAETTEVDVAVVDYHLGGRNGLELVASASGCLGHPA
jgi:ActR/RegA family two-component response regulator